MMKTLRSRLEVLEQYFAVQTEPEPRFIIVMHCLPRETILRDGERAVLDIYREFGQMQWARERVTTDPNDNGQSCDPCGFLLPVLEELHQSCEYHLRNESCNTCIGTPVCPQTKGQSPAVAP